jgi:polyisoprenoid-binding protein YceI
MLVYLPIPLLAQNYYAENGTANFTSSVPLYEFTGTSEQLTGLINLTDNSVDFYLDLETLDSGIKKRDKDMRLTLKTKKFPFTEFYGSLLDSVDLTNLNPQRIRTRGNFSIHGVTREVDVEGEITVEQNALHITANWEIRLDDFDIVPPSLLIVKVDQIQKISIDIRLDKQ